MGGINLRINYAAMVMVVIALVMAEMIRAAGPLGVDPEVLSKYTRSDGKFRCLDGTKLMEITAVNDDYCDCADGTDEPGTAACPNGSFYCQNFGYIPAKIPSSRVNDGLCDCCDGSDEYKGTTCENTCAELQAQLMEKLQKKYEVENQGWEKKKAMIQQAEEMTARRSKEITELKTSIENLKVEVEQLKQAKLEAEKRENQLREQQRAKGQSDITFLSQQTEQHCSDLKRQVEVLSAKLAQMKDSVSILESNLQSGSEYTLATIGKLFEELKENIPTVPTFCAAAKTTALPKATMVDSDDGDDAEEYHDSDDFDVEVDVDSSYEVDDKSDDGDRSEDGSADQPELQAAKEAAQNAKRTYDDKKQDLSYAENRLAELEQADTIDFGPLNVFSVLHSRCFTLDTNEYTYEFCPFKTSNQKPKKGGSQTLLGTFTSWGGLEDNKYSAMKFENGLRCWGGPDRSLRVNIRCGVEDKILSVEEPAKCEYVMEFTSPAGCSEAESIESVIQKQRANKDEL